MNDYILHFPTELNIEKYKIELLNGDLESKLIPKIDSIKHKMYECFDITIKILDPTNNDELKLYEFIMYKSEMIKFHEIHGRFGSGSSIRKTDVMIELDNYIKLVFYGCDIKDIDPINNIFTLIPTHIEKLI
jgi:hypothetical protein